MRRPRETYIRIIGVPRPSFGSLVRRPTQWLESALDRVQSWHAAVSAAAVLAVMVGWVAWAALMVGGGDISVSERSVDMTGELTINGSDTDAAGLQEFTGSIE
ncbi:MAG: hypothetical protein WD535_05775, partial [Thermaerobacterales bacterium]